MASKSVHHFPSSTATPHSSEPPPDFQITLLKLFRSARCSPERLIYDPKKSIWRKIEKSLKPQSRQKQSKIPSLEDCRRELLSRMKLLLMHRNARVSISPSPAALLCSFYVVARFDKKSREGLRSVVSIKMGERWCTRLIKGFTKVPEVINPSCSFLKICFLCRIAMMAIWQSALLSSPWHFGNLELSVLKEDGTQHNFLKILFPPGGNVPPFGMDTSECCPGHALHSVQLPDLHAFIYILALSLSVFIK